MKKRLLAAVVCAAFCSASSVSAASLSRGGLKKAVALNESATAKTKSGDLDGAEADLLAALEYAGAAPALQKNLGVVYYEKSMRASREGDAFQAQKYAKQALDTDPGNTRYAKALSGAYFTEAESRAKKGQDDEAMALYEKAADADPSNLSAWTQAANFAWKTHRLDDAARLLEKARAIDPKDKNVIFLEGKLKDDAPDPKEEAPKSKALESEHFILPSQEVPGSPEDARSVLDELENVYRDVSYRLDFAPGSKIAVVFYPVGDFHTHWNLPYRVNGFYDGKLRLPFSRGATIESLRPMIRHELAHAFVSAMTQKPIPQWLNEGLAQWIEGRELDPKSKDAFVTRQLWGQVPDMEGLDRALSAQKNPYNDTQMTLAYMKSFSLVAFLIETAGVHALVEYIKHRADDDGGDFEKYFTAPAKEIEERWLRWVERKKSYIIIN